MAKTRQKVQMPAGIRRKMSAAISMLLVACIMLVSATYAWFTLSTAPEVTGISTRVGANGNLEIALLNDNTYDSMESITTNEGDSMDTANKKVTEANVTWGNLVDLSDVSYGLSNLTLAPAELNIADENGSTVGSSMLRTPEYGSDGRVSTVTANTVTGTYDLTKGAYLFNEAKYGVRAIGTASSLTTRQLQYRNAISNLASYISQATNIASTSLTDNGSALGTIVVKMATEDNPSYGEDDKKTVNIIISDIAKANEALGNAIKQAVIASALNKESTVSFVNKEEATVLEIVNNISGADFTVESLKTASKLDSLSDEITNAITKYIDTADRINKAEALVDSNIKNALGKLVEIKQMVVSGYSYDGVKANTNELVNSIIKNGVVIEMYSNSGVYSNISDTCGNYSATIAVSVQYGSYDLNDVPATMKTMSIGTPKFDESGKYTGTENASSNHYLTTALADVKGKEPEGTQSKNAAITDTYGYALDFAFRTNAASSNLKLQTAEKQRVYENSGASGTQGEGSYMEFAITDTFGEAKVKALMSAIRVAFVQESESSIGVLGIARLETATDTSQEPSTVDENGEETTTTAATTVKAYLYMCDYSYDMTDVTEVTDGILNAGALKKDNATITTLNQNEATKVTVIVYLDGNVVDNSMVANAATSMSGKLNLQFTSDAQLTPMENSALRNAVSGKLTDVILKANLSEENKTTLKTALGVESLDAVKFYKDEANSYYYSTNNGMSKKSIPSITGVDFNDYFTVSSTNTD